MVIVLLLTLGSVQAENMRHDRLVALLSDPGSDLSGLKGDYNLQAAAALDARLYFKKHNNREYEKDCLGIGLEHAVKHHLKSNQKYLKFSHISPFPVGSLVRGFSLRSTTLRLIKVESDINDILTAGGWPLVCPTWVQCSQMKGMDRKQ